MMLLRSSYILTLIEHENCIALLYERFAQLFPAQSDFWRSFVREEYAHAEVLRRLQEQLPTLASPGPFHLREVREAIEWIRAQIECLPTRGCSPTQALDLALQIENSLIESDFFAIFPDDTEDTRHEFEALRTHTLQHIARLEKTRNRDQ